jgi:hypothetical protein
VNQLELQTGRIPYRERLTGYELIPRLQELKAQGIHVESLSVGSHNAEWLISFMADPVPALWAGQPEPDLQPIAPDESLGF